MRGLVGDGDDDDELLDICFRFLADNGTTIALCGLVVRINTFGLDVRVGLL